MKGTTKTSGQAWFWPVGASKGERRCARCYPKGLFKDCFRHSLEWPCIKQKTEKKNHEKRKKLLDPIFPPSVVQETRRLSGHFTRMKDDKLSKIVFFGHSSGLDEKQSVPEWDENINCICVKYIFATDGDWECFYHFEDGEDCL